MNNFTFQNTTRIIFGKNTIGEIGKEISQFGKKVMIVHYHKSFLKDIKVEDIIVNSFKENNIKYVELVGVEPNPKLSLVNKGIDICRNEKVDFLLAVGGGSAIDTAKAIALGVNYKGDVWDFSDGTGTVDKVLPIGVILTIPAAGSETSSGAVITNEKGLLKRVLAHNDIRPKFAILNPELTYSLPKYQTACGIVDIMSHAMERYFTSVKNVEFTDRLCEATIKTVINNGRIVLKDGNNYDARAEIMMAANIAHNGLLGCGRVGDWASHYIEHEIGAIYDIAHGAGLAIVTPHWMRYVYKHDINRFVRFAHEVFNIDINYSNLEETALKGIEALENFFKEIGMPTKLSEVNIGNENFEIMAVKTLESRKGLGSIKPMTKEDIINILNMCI